MGPRPGQRVPGRRGHAARPQGGPAAAVGAGRGRGGPGAARGPRPAVRPAAAVPRVQGGRRGVRRADGRRGPAGSPRQDALEPHFASLLPELVISITPEQLAALAAGERWRPKAAPTVGLAHLHAPAVSVREQAAVDRRRLRAVRHHDLPGARPRTPRAPSWSWPGSWPCSSCSATAPSAFDQVSPLGELTIRWTGSDDGEVARQRRVRPRSRATRSRRGSPMRKARRDGRDARPVSTGGTRQRLAGADTRALRRRRTGEPPRGPQGPVVDVDTLPGGAAGALEAVLMVVDEPVSEVALATALGLTRDRVREELATLAGELRRGGPRLRAARGRRRLAVLQRPAYAAGGRGVRAGRPAGQADPGRAGDPGRRRLPPAGRRGRVSAVRGVNVDGVMRTLVARGLVEEAGSDHETGAILYGTTTLFLERLGLTSLDELPALAPYLPEVDALDELSGDRSGMTPAPGRSTGRRRGMMEPVSAPSRHRGRAGHESAPGAGETRRGRSDRSGRSQAQPRQGPPARPSRRRRPRTCTTPTASGCRRCWPRPASAAAAPARS